MKVNITGSLSHGVRQKIRREARMQMLETHKKINADFDAMVLWVLHSRFGFGKKRLERFYEEFLAEYEQMKEYYASDDDTIIFAAREKLKQIGVDVYEWNTGRKEQDK